MPSNSRFIKGIFLLLLGLLTFPAAALNLQDMQGNKVLLEDSLGKGKWTIVMIWASDCHICNAEVENYVLFHEGYRKKNARILGLTIDGQAGMSDAKAFISRHQVNFPNLLGEADEVGEWYTATTGVVWYGTPSFLIYGPDGRLLAQQAGAVPVDLIEGFIQRHTP